LSFDPEKSAEAEAISFFYLPTGNIDGRQCRLPPEESHHLVAVLRVEAGDMIQAVDGCGSLYSVRIQKADRRETIGTVLSQKELVNELPIDITVALGLLTSAKTEQVIDQCTQLGARRFQPLQSGLATAKLSRERFERKQERWRKVALAAMKQSRRCVLPEISQPVDLEALVERLGEFDRVLLGSMTGAPASSSLEIAHKSTVLLLTGPEEGFSRAEEKLLVEQGACPIRLGSRRLRAELAPVVLLSNVLSVSGLFDKS
jgi:16S rRNA (uracil1498-N3)-methyltransferase